MKTDLGSIYTTVLDKIIQKQSKVKTNTIFVLAGITPYINTEHFAEMITDITTFDKDGNADIYSREWFGGVFSKLVSTHTAQIISHQQFAYLNEYLAEDFFKERIIIINDNLRSQYPLAKKDYLEGNNSNEERPDCLPIYQAEQYKIGERYYYSLKGFSDTFVKKSFFVHGKELETGSTQDAHEILDVISDPYAIDNFINHCIEESNFNKQIFVKVSGKNVLNTTTLNTLKELNHLLSSFGGGVYILQEETIRQDYTPKEETTALLKQYWGDNAEFRNILVYENPELNSNIVPVSQGLIVETIIDEYKNGCNGILPRDIFITAPTGAGKSLIFQLPAFYAANNGDVTIVVSPLKALMTDQVEILHKQRHYDKVEFLNSDLTLIDRDKIIDSCKKGDIDILYLSPELLLSYDIHYFLGERKLGLLIVDEAHLITTWGRDFRVDYWFLGNHINKIRKFNNYMFPMVALTATAVYGGVNDMVFDSINSLNMHDPHKFIGNVRRNNIEFVLNTHDDYTSGNYDQNKETETIDFIKGIHELGMKGIVYAPYTRHINRLKDKADEIDTSMIVAYHGGMQRDQQQYSYQAFRSNQCKIMVSTKAFGMGVDIPDIQVVYHHAPSGLLPDYIQEIGRAARKDNIQGFAALTFSKSVLRYSKQLFGISSLKTFQLQEVLRKIIRCFNNNGKKRNLLVAANDFAYIFNTEEEIDQKVATALMMIEKDYLVKTRFNVLIARPKKLFTKVYARTTDIGVDKLHKLYGDCFTEIRKFNTYHTIELNLDKIWSNHFSDKSFPQLKSDFYKQRFLYEQNIELVPQIKVSITIEQPYQTILHEMQSVMNSINDTFSQFRYRGHFFSKPEFIENLSQKLNHKYNAEKIADFILSTYSGYMSSANTLEGDSFLQQRHQGTSMQYQVFSSNYAAKTAQLLNVLSKLYENADRQTVVRYLSINDIPLKNHIRLGSLLEIMNLGIFETTGGDDPKMFLRLNDPRRVEKDSISPNYNNTILDSVKNRHTVSCQIFEHFFTNYFSNAKRWDMIEDFFLGMSNDDLFEKYPGTMVNHVNIIDYLKENASISESINCNINNENAYHSELFKPKENEFYFKDNLLTIGRHTKAIKKWVAEDPIALHRTIVEYNIRVEKEYFNVLSNKLRLNQFEYYRDYMGLRLLIEFPGYTGLVQASVPYNLYPVKFYKWWRQNEEKIRLTNKEQIALFIAVENENPKALLKKHKNQLIIKKQ